MFDITYILTLDIRPERFFYSLGGLISAGFPVAGNSTPWGDHIVKWDGPGLSKHLCRDPIRVASEYADRNNFRLPKLLTESAGDTACSGLLLNLIGALKDMISRDCTGLFVIDDAVPLDSWTFATIHQMLARARIPHLRFLNLNYSWNLPPRDVHDTGDVEPWSNYINDPKLEYINDLATIFTPVGARQFISQFQNLSCGQHSDSFIVEFMRATEFKGCYRSSHHIFKGNVVHFGSDLIGEAQEFRPAYFKYN